MNMNGSTVVVQSPLEHQHHYFNFNNLEVPISSTAAKIYQYGSPGHTPFPTPNHQNAHSTMTSQFQSNRKFGMSSNPPPVPVNSPVAASKMNDHGAIFPSSQLHSHLLKDALIRRKLELNDVRIEKVNDAEEPSSTTNEDDHDSVSEMCSDVHSGADDDEMNTIIERISNVLMSPPISDEYYNCGSSTIGQSNTDVKEWDTREKKMKVLQKAYDFIIDHKKE